MVVEDMRTEPVSNRTPRCRTRGFTLVEVMIAMAIIGILARIALPSYREYILRGQLVDATTLLATQRGNMERYFQDNRTYAAVGTTIYPPCHANIAVAQRTQGNFVVSCTGTDLTATTFTLTATGSGPASGFTYTVNQLDNRATSAVGVTGWNTSTTCWVVKKGQTC
jgi:type IV pilus assembly protein PilE